MEKLTVTHTYAQALFDAARESGHSHKIGEEYKAVSRVFAENPMLKKLFCVPTITAADKKGVAEKVFKGRVSQELLNFILILIDKRRISAWEDIGKQYEKLEMESEKHARGVLYSAVPLAGERLKHLERKTDAVVGKRVRLENRVDRTLLGGVKIYVDGKMIDASLKTGLENMKQRILQ